MSTQTPDQLLTDLALLASWLSRHAARHADQQAADQAFILTVGQAIGKLEVLDQIIAKTKQPEGVVPAIVALAARLTIQENRMSQLSDFATKVKDIFGSISTSVDGLATDVKTLNDTIKQLQASPEDQALMTAAVEQGQALADKAKALDELTAAPPVPPPGA